MNETYIVALIGAGSSLAVWLLSFLVGLAKNRKEKAQQKEANYNKVKDEIGNQIEEFQANLLKQNEAQQKENQVLKKEIREVKDRFEVLKARFDSIKNSLLTLNLFGSLSPIAMWIKDSQGKRIYHNAAYEQLTGVSLSENMGKTDLQIMEDQVISDNWDDADNKVKQSKAPIIAIELCANVKNPTNIFKVLTFKWPVMLSGEVIGIEGAAIPLSLISDSLGIKLEALEELL